MQLRNLVFEGEGWAKSLGSAHPATVAGSNFFVRKILKPAFCLTSVLCGGVGGVGIFAFGSARRSRRATPQRHGKPQAAVCDHLGLHLEPEDSK